MKSIIVKVVNINEIQKLFPVAFNIKLSDELLKRHTWGDVDFSLISTKALLSSIEEVLEDNLFSSEEVMQVDSALKTISYENCYFDLNTIEKY